MLVICGPRLGMTIQLMSYVNRLTVDSDHRVLYQYGSGQF